MIFLFLYGTIWGGKLKKEKNREDFMNSKFNICLNPVSDSLAFTQGFGRTAREAVILREDKDGFYLTYSGIVFKKKEK